MKFRKIVFVLAKTLGFIAGPTTLVASPEQVRCETDEDFTRRIRASLINDKSLSVRARHIKIVTSGGVTTISGPVANPEEKSKIEELSQSVLGKVRLIKNNLEVTTK